MRKWFVVPITAVLAAIVADAQPAQRGGGSFPMQRADANGDGRVSWSEARKTAPGISQERFNNLDRNGDGLLSKADVSRDQNRSRGNFPQGEQLAAILRRADADGDGRVTKRELQASAPRLARSGFARLDVNKDGVISEADFRDARNSVGPSPQAIRRADANGDGFWSYEEIKRVAKQLPERAFKSVDEDGDGLLNSNELQALRRLGNRPSNRSRNNAQTSSYRRDSVEKLLDSDTNRDGGVTFEELVAAKPGYPRVNFDGNDRNNDGVVSGADVP